MVRGSPIVELKTTMTIIVVYSSTKHLKRLHSKKKERPDYSCFCHDYSCFFLIILVFVTKSDLKSWNSYVDLSVFHSEPLKNMVQLYNWYFSAKGNLISESFSLWLKSPKKRCQITSLSSRDEFELKGFEPSRAEPSWGTLISELKPS